VGLLTSNWLRATTRSLRQNNPRMYARLNDIRNRILAGETDLAAYQASALRRFRSLCLRSAAGKRVLEIGSDPNGRVLRQLSKWGVSKAVGVNPAEEIWASSGTDHQVTEQATLRRADARSLPFDDASFDAIFSVATFEHILDLPKALAEMHRVLRPGGSLYANFGPIWSGCRGHHIRVQVGEREFRHFRPESNPLPDYCHLLMTRRELREALTDRLAVPYVEPIVTWVFDDPGINRWFHHQYLQAFSESPFNVVSVRSERDRLDGQLGRILRFRYPQESAFDVTNVEVVLSKQR
jgi:ubiquinone/menaquinone biosynthesis C-methylase UbiE